MRCALRKARTKRPLCPRARRMSRHLERMTAQESTLNAMSRMQNGLGDRTGLKDEIDDFAADKEQQDGRKMHWFRENP
jgi:hypothetical protein